jgi:3-hydroxybutyryl-CoA dehydrogenase
MTPRIAIVGAGRMGAGIAQTFAYAGMPSTLIDLKRRPRGRAQEVLDRAAGEIAASLGSLVDAGVINAADCDEIAARVTYVVADDAADALSDAEFVFEGVPEVLEAKRDAFADICARVPQDAVIASTTSSFLVDMLSGGVTAPERFLNAHWLNPAYLMPLVEVSPGAATSREVVDALTRLLRRAGKVPVECAPSPGYIVPRIQALAMNEAARLVDEGVASPEGIDTATRVGFGLRFALLGLIEFIDWGGCDTLFYASEYLRDELGDERFAPAASVAERMREGAIGMKAGRGFHSFEGRDVAAYQRETIARFVGLLEHLGLLPAPVTTRTKGAVDGDPSIAGAPPGAV